MAEHDGVVPHIVSELLGHKQVVLPMYMATPDHQPSVSSVCKLAKVKTYASRKPTTRFDRCRARCAHLYPSLVLGQVITRRGFLRCGRDAKANPSYMPSPTTTSLGGSFSPNVNESSPDVKFQGVLVGLCCWLLHVPQVVNFCLFESCRLR
jgi:hypothetical protein